MKKIRGSKIFLAGTAVLMAGALCGCSVRFGTRKEPAADKVVAYPTKGEDNDDLKVLYGDFSKEYKFFLANNYIEDDTADYYASACTQQRDTLIYSLINEKIILHKAKEMGVYELTEEQQKAVDNEYDQKIATIIKTFGDRAEKELAEKQESSSEDSDTSAPVMTEEEKEEAGGKMLDDMLEKAGMTRDDLRWWMESNRIITNVQEKIYDSVDRSKAEELLKEQQKIAEELYKTDVSKYEQGGYSQIAYTQMWIPKEARNIKHILLSFDDETKTKITSLRREGKDDEADKLREESAENLKEKQAEVEKKLDDGAKIDDLIPDYNSDPGAQSYPDGYTVIPNGSSYVEEFQKAAFVPEKIGDRTSCVTDFGVHIMEYASNAKVPEENITKITDKFYAELQSDEFDNKIGEWLDEYVFTIDYETLRLTPPETSNTGTSE